MEVGDITLRDRLVGLLEQIFYHGRQFEQEALHQLASKATADDIDADLALLIEASRHYWKRQHEDCLALITPWLDDEAVSAASPRCILALVIWYRSLARMQRHVEAAAVVERAERLRPATTALEHMAMSMIRGQAMLNLKRYDVAARHLDQAYMLAARCGYDVTGAIINIDRAVVASECGDAFRAIVMYEDSIRVLTSAPDGFRPLCLAAKFNVATVYPGVGRDEDALCLYADVVYESQRWNLPGYYLTARLNMAISLKTLHRYDDARSAYSEVLEHAVTEGHRQLQFRACAGLSDLFMLLKDVESAQSMATQALEIADSTGIASLRHEALGNLANIDHHRGDYERAIERLSIAFDGSWRGDDGSRSMKYGRALSATYAKIGLFEAAYRILRQCSDHQQGLNAKAIERTAEATAMQMKLASDRNALEMIEAEREQMLRAVVPEGIAERLMAGERHIADAISDVTIMFVDIVGFTEMASAMDPESLLLMLEELFTTFDEICARNGCERVKTIGDSYMAICGATTPFDDHAIRMCRAALEITSADTLLPLERDRLRIGIHSGPVVAGVMSGSRLSYDVWGEAVSMAAMMESLAEPGRIHCSESVAVSVDLIQGIYLEQRAPLTIADKGRFQTYWLSGT